MKTGIEPHYLDSCLCIPENSQNISGRLYPNPTSDEFTLLTYERIISLHAYSVVGKEVEIEKLNENNYSIEALPSGIYHLVIEFETEKIYSKITRM